MNALISRFIKAPVLVVHMDWLLLDPPELHLRLSDNRYCKIQWSLEDRCARLFIASDKQADFVSCSRKDVGIDPDELEMMVEQVRRAVVAEEEERLADAYDDGREG